MISYNVSAGQEFRTFYQKIRLHFENFKIQLNQSKPLFSMADVEKNNNQKSSSLISSTLSSVMPASWISDEQSKKTSSSQSSQQIYSPNEKIDIDIHKPISLTALKKVIESQKGRELHGYSPYGAFSFIVHAFQEEWDDISLKLMKSVYLETQTLMEKVAHDVFGRFYILSSQTK
jgi:hypothetical protein